MISNINATIELDEFEIIVVNSGGASISGITKYQTIHVHDMPRGGAPQARNLGAANASGDILVFADAHLEFRKGWGPKIRNTLELNNMSIVTPCITAMGDDASGGCGFKWSDISMQIFWLPDLISSIHEIPFACSCCMAVEKKVFNEIGRFDSGTRFWGEEDSEINQNTMSDFLIIIVKVLTIHENSSL
jgi:glycosyltransferase involved in cell wall biosynthesis